MRFPNAFDGVSKIRTSQILAVVATALLFISAILGLAMIPLSSGGPGNALYALLAAFGFVAMAAGSKKYRFLIPVHGRYTCKWDIRQCCYRRGCSSTCSPVPQKHPE